MDDLQAQVMLSELEQQRAAISSLLGTRCVELQVALATANKRIKELETPKEAIKKEPKKVKVEKELAP